MPTTTNLFLSLSSLSFQPKDQIWNHQFYKTELFMFKKKTKKLNLRTERLLHVIAWKYSVSMIKFSKLLNAKEILCKAYGV